MSDEYLHGHKIHPDPNRPDDPTAGVIYVDILPKIKKPIRISNCIDAIEWNLKLLKLQSHFIQRQHKQIEDITAKWINVHNGGKPR